MEKVYYYSPGSNMNPRIDWENLRHFTASNLDVCIQTQRDLPWWAVTTVGLSIEEINLTVFTFHQSFSCTTPFVCISARKGHCPPFIWLTAIWLSCHHLCVFDITYVLGSLLHGGRLPPCLLTAILTHWQIISVGSWSATWYLNWTLNWLIDKCSNLCVIYENLLYTDKGEGYRYFHMVVSCLIIEWLSSLK